MPPRSTAKKLSSTIKKGPDKTAPIRRAAYACFAKAGYHDTAVDDICREAGISKGAFYWHYASKQAVFLDILHTWADEAEREMVAQFTAALSTPDIYRSVAAALRREAKRGRAIVPLWLEFLSQVQRSPEIRAGVADFHRRIRSALTTMLSPVLEDVLAPKDIRALAGTVLAAFLGLVAQELGDPREASFDAHATSFLKLVELLLGDVPKTPTRIHARKKRSSTTKETS